MKLAKAVAKTVLLDITKIAMKRPHAQGASPENFKMRRRRLSAYTAQRGITNPKGQRVSAVPVQVVDIRAQQKASSVLIALPVLFRHRPGKAHAMPALLDITKFKFKFDRNAAKNVLKDGIKAKLVKHPAKNVQWENFRVL